MRLRDPKRDDIQALLETPELRRIFEGRPPKPPTGSDAQCINGGAGAEHRASQTVIGASARRRSVWRRTVVGLVPVYLAIPIFLYEAGPEAADPFHILGSRDSADEARPEPAAELAATAASPAVQRIAVAAAEGAPTGNGVSGGSRSVTTAKHRPKEVVTAGGRLGDTHEKSAADLGKRPSEQGLAAPRPAFAAVREETPAEVVASSSVVSDRPPADGTTQNGRYPDPRVGAIAGVGLAVPDPEQAAAAEEALGLSRSDRREIQRRLRLANFDPQFIDGIFGPATRDAIGDWQVAAGIPASGYMDEAAMALLVEQTANEYSSWRAAERARAREEARDAVVATSAPPEPAAAVSDGCRRSASGAIPYGQGMRCDVRGLREDFRGDLSDLKRELGRLFR